MKYQDFSFYWKIASSSPAAKILFLSFTCEDIGVDMVTNMISQLQNWASRSGARPVVLKFHSQNGFEVRRQYGNRWLCRWAAKFNLHIDPFSEFEEHSRRFAEVSESDVEKFIEGEENANTKNKTFYDL